jgi:bacteriocin biosynthesis cyclodehydratase domain-containing protein
MGDQPDLVVLTGAEPVETEHRDALHARDSAHLRVQVHTTVGIVGPLVLPGRTSCLRCADLHRLDRDPLWNALAVQLTIPRPRGPACETALASLVAALAAQQTLAYLDGAAPAVINGTLEQHLPDWRIRRRSWLPHPKCDCGAG